MKEKSSRVIPLQLKLSGVFIAASLLVLIVNMILMIGIRNMSGQMDLVYQDNMKLNELSNSLTLVQQSMTEYLNTKTSDSLNDYYRNEQKYNKLIRELNTSIVSDEYALMERDIRNMSEEYLKITENAIEAKRGRNVEKYSMEYDEASKLFDYISTYIESLNRESFKSNSQNYSELISAFNVFASVSTIVMVGAIIGSSVFVIIFTRNMVEPVKKLAKSADEVANGNFEIETLEITSRDEVGVVTGAFNEMVVSIRHYIDQVKEGMENERKMKEKELMIEATLKDAQLKYLQTQINPHFLFNTLNAGAQLAMLEDAERTYDYIQNTAEFFRYNVREGNTVVKLKDEISLIDHYMYILNVRFSGDIKYEKIIETEIDKVDMPSMILQPIVENSINHGIKEMEGKGKILVRVYRDGNEVVISVKDNGTGMNQEVIDRILKGEFGEEEKPAPAGAHGIGMDNVIKRLRLYTNNEECINIVSDGEGMGTETIIRLNAEIGE